MVISIRMLIMKGTKSYFDMHGHYHAYHKNPDFYSPLINYIRKSAFHSNGKMRVFDLGCGDGSFIQAFIKAGISADYIGSDISQVMINMAKQNLDYHRIGLFVADGFKLPLQPQTKFDIIHIDSVLHHLIEITRSKSWRLSNKMLDLLVSMLFVNGILIVEEYYYDSYIIPHITSSIVFYGLKLLKFLRLDISKIMTDCKPGLEVNFFYEKQLCDALKHYGTVQRIKKRPDKLSKLQRVFLAKDIGHVSYILKV